MACHCLHGRTYSRCDKPCLKAKELVLATVCLHMLCVCVCVCYSQISVTFGIIHLYNSICQQRLPWCTASVLSDLEAVPPQIRPEVDTQSHGCDTYRCGPAQTLLSCAFGACQLPSTTLPSGSTSTHLAPLPPPLLLLLPLHLPLRLSSGPQGVAERIPRWPRSQGCPG